MYNNNDNENNNNNNNNNNKKKKKKKKNRSETRKRKLASSLTWHRLSPQKETAYENDRNLIILHKYKDLEIKIERMWGMKTSTILVVIDAFIVISIAKQL